MEMARTLGAEQVIDYTREDFTKREARYDLILAANGYHSIYDYKHALRPNGTYVLAGGTMAQVFQAMLLGPWLSMTGRNKICHYVAQPNSEDLVFLAALIEAGKIRPVIDRQYALSEVPDAIRYLENEHAHGKVVIRMQS